MNCIGNYGKHKKCNNCFIQNYCKKIPKQTKNIKPVYIQIHKYNTINIQTNKEINDILIPFPKVTKNHTLYGFVIKNLFIDCKYKKITNELIKIHRPLPYEHFNIYTTLTLDKWFATNDMIDKYNLTIDYIHPIITYKKYILYKLDKFLKQLYEYKIVRFNDQKNIEILIEYYNMKIGGKYEKN